MVHLQEVVLVIDRMQQLQGVYPLDVVLQLEPQGLMELLVPLTDQLIILAVLVVPQQEKLQTVILL